MVPPRVVRPWLTQSSHRAPALADLLPVQLPGTCERGEGQDFLLQTPVEAFSVEKSISGQTLCLWCAPAAACAHPTHVHSCRAPQSSASTFNKTVLK